jgi:hypothetical protein
MDEDFIKKAVKYSPKYSLKRRANRRKPPLKTFWWRYKYPAELNFGDEITPYILWSIWGRRCEWAKPDECDLAGAGSIIEMLQRKSNGKTIRVWGSGFIRQEEEEKGSRKNLVFYAVRGPVSLARIGRSDGVALGDPGILANLVFRRAKKVTYKAGVLAHYVDADAKSLELIKDNPDYLLIDPLQTPDKVALDITSCQYVLSSSLHGLIFADSFGVPNNWMPLSDKVIGGDYKFKDYYESTGRELIKQKPGILNNQNEINKAVKSYKPVDNLEQIQADLIGALNRLLKDLEKRK